MMPSAFVTRLIDLAHTRPDDEAVTDLAQTWTFAELCGRAAGVAHRLAAADRAGAVGLLVDRSLPSVASLFGTWWAGRTTIAIDVAEPEARLAEYCERSGTDTLIDLTGRAPGRLAGIDVWGDDGVTLPSSGWPAVTLVAPTQVAQIQFTSGSTGRPKGVVKTFEVIDSSLALWPLTGYLRALRSAVFLPLHFAGGFAPIISGLTTGRFTALVDATRMSPDETVEVMRRYAIEQMYVTPSLLRTMVAGLSRPAALDELQRVWTVGEPAMWSDVADARRGLSTHVVFGSGYGATEALALRCVMEVGPDAPLGEGRLPLGRPTAPDWLRIDREGHTGGVGEAVYRGALAVGYLGDPELQTTRFGVDPDGVRTWRSGDLVVESDGVLVHRGRIDDMVKIAGRLVEPSEAETALAQIAGIRNSCVLVRRLRSGRAQLVAHVETEDGVLRADVVAALHATLASHLVPSVIVRHERLPLNDRGKVDRARINESVLHPWRDTPPEPAHDPLTTAVLGVARSLLELDGLGADDDLLAYGLDSLGAIELAATITDAGHGEFHPQDLMGAPTPRLIAELLRNGQHRTASDAVVLNPSATGVPLFLVCGAGGFALSYQALVLAVGPDHPAVIFQQHGLTSRGRRERSIAANARRHLRTLQAMRPTGPYVVAGHSWGGLVAHEMARRLRMMGNDVRVVLLDTRRPPSDPRRNHPEALRTRSASWPVHLAKVLRWRQARVSKWVADRRAPVGTTRRYDSFYGLADRGSARARIPAIDVPVTHVWAEGGRPHDWDDHPQLSVVGVRGDHLTMLQPPNVTAVADAVRTVLQGATRAG